MQPKTKRRTDTTISRCHCKSLGINLAPSVTFSAEALWLCPLLSQTNTNSGWCLGVNVGNDLNDCYVSALIYYFPAYFTNYIFFSHCNVVSMILGRLGVPVLLAHLITIIDYLGSELNLWNSKCASSTLYPG